MVNFPNESLGKPTRFMPGRQRQVFDLLSLFQTSKLVALIGENGSGKTHLVKNGLIPELEKGFLGMAGKKWKTVTIRPGITPLENLSAGIIQLNSENGKQKLEAEIQLTEMMRRNNEGLKNMFLQNFDQYIEANSLIVIDNFEDLFQYKEVAANRNEWEDTVKSFIYNLCKCATNNTIPIYFLIVLRTDYVPKIFEYRQFYDVLSTSQYNLPQFRKSEFYEFIQAQLSPLKKTINKDAIDLFYLKLGKDLKNLTLIGLFLEEAITILDSRKEEEIKVELFDEISIDLLYSKRLDLFYDQCSKESKKLLEKILKQITISQEGTKFRKPIQIDHFLKVSGSTLPELGSLIQSLQSRFTFILDLVYPLHERLESDELTGISETAVIDIKNEQFIYHWPRLLHWIKEEKESQDLYKRLSDKATLHERGLTDFLKPPDLDYAIVWYKEKKPDELWSRQFDNNHKKTIAFLFESQKKHQEELNKKEFEQKERIKRLRKTTLYVLLGAFVVIILVSSFAFMASKAEEEAEVARMEAIKDKLEAEADKQLAIAAEKKASDAVENANLSAKEAMDAYLEADLAMKQALRSDSITQQSQTALQAEQEKLLASNQELNVKKEEAESAKKDAESSRTDALNAKAYQESINKILALRNVVEAVDYLDNEIKALIDNLKNTYESYRNSSLAHQKVVLPNNDLYQLLQEVRTELVKKNLLPQIDFPNLKKPNGLRKISISPMGNIASGGDDGVLIFSKRPISMEKIEFFEHPIGKDRIRSMEFLNEKELAVGTVNGKLIKFNTETQVMEPIPLGLTTKPIIEKLLLSKSGLFVLASGNLIKVDLNNSGTFTAINRISAKNMFRINDEKFLIAGKDNSLIVLDTNTLQWVTVGTDLKKIPITAAVTSDNRIIIGLDNGEIQVCKFSQLGNVYTITTEFSIFAHRTRITNLDYDKTTSKLFTSSLDQTANIFDLKLRDINPDYVTTNRYQLEGFKKWIWDFGLLQIGKYKFLISADESGVLKFWPADSEKLYNEIQAAGSVIPK